VAAIDVGSSGIRMEIAEVGPDGRAHRLDSLQRSVLLGNDTFSTGRLSNESTVAACEALRQFRKVMDELGVIRHRAVATNAVHEAENCDAFLDRVQRATGFELEVIDGAELSRLTYSAVQDSLASAVDFESGVVAVTEVGGGALDVMILDRGEAVYADTFALGAIRIRQAMRNARGSVKERQSFLRHLVQVHAQNVLWTIPLERVQTLIALGGDVRFLAQQVLPDAPPSSHLWVIPREEFLSACARIAAEDTDELAERYHLSFGNASTLAPALLLQREIARSTKADRVFVSNASIRDGLLLDMARQASGAGKETYARETVASAVGVARKYHTDEKHALHVGAVATALFDEMRPEHGLGAQERLLLEVAAILHEVGLFVHNRAHHKHTLYLISCSEIFGLRRNDVQIVANIARYHRRSPPQATHPQFMALDRSERIAVCKLAAMLRVADAVDKSHTQSIRSPRFERHQGELRVLVPKDTDIRLESLYLEEKGDLFLEMFGLKPTLVPSAE
jgi:exopolyphosphatase/guanosine-5'-triphosphate,3'-diphosphate pyrophosphatase